MQNTLRTTRITAPTRFALLALGAISLSCLALPARAGDDAPDAGAKNPSTCRDVVNKKCLMKPNDGQSSQNQDTRNQDKAQAARDDAAIRRAEQGAGIHSVTGIPKYDSAGRITSVDYPKLGYSERSYYDQAIIRVYRNGDQKLVYVPNRHDKEGRYVGAPAPTGSRHTVLAPGARTNAPTMPPKAAIAKNTTTDKTTNTMTRDYRTGATAAAGGPPPAAAIGSSSKPTAEQLAAQSGTRDHKHK
jgi:hypothetical protein